MNKMRFTDIFIDDTSNVKKIPKNEYDKIGIIPIIDQGKEYISGYSEDRKGKQIKGERIIFGDHTRIIKYINFNAYIGADGVKVLKIKQEGIDYKYMYYYLKKSYLPNTGYNRHFKWLKNLDFNIVDISEQKKIVKKIDKIQEVINLRKKQIKYFNEIIKSQFVEMFQSGNYPNEELGKLCDVRDGTHDSPKYMEKSDYKFITSKNIINNGIDFSDVKYISKKDYDKFNTRSKVNYGDILMPMIGTIGKPMIVNIPDSEIDFAIKNVALIKFLDNSQVTNIYIKYLLDSDYFENAILQNKRGGTQKFIALSDIRKIQIEIPPIELQNQFAEIVKQIDKQKFEIENSLKEMQELYESLMKKYFG